MIYHFFLYYYHYHQLFYLNRIPKHSLHFETMAFWQNIFFITAISGYRHRAIVRLVDSCDAVTAACCVNLWAPKNTSSQDAFF